MIPFKGTLHQVPTLGTFAKFAVPRLRIRGFGAPGSRLRGLGGSWGLGFRVEVRGFGAQGLGV